MKNQPRTMKKHENPPRTMKNHKELDLRPFGKVIIFRDRQTDRTFLLYIDFHFLQFALLCREHGTHQNWSLPKIGPTGHILAKNQFFCFVNQIFVNEAFVALCVTTILPVGPITISLFAFELEPFECGSPFSSESLYPAPFQLPRVIMWGLSL